MVRPGAGAALPDVGVTGVGVAAIRAAESVRADRLFDDPFAGRFAEAAGWQPPDRDPAGRARLSAWIAVRTRFLDEVALGACAQGCRQVVILGAGLDARAFRLSWPTGTRVWELDLPAVLDFKEDVVRSARWVVACGRTVVRADLTAAWEDPLVEAGLDTGRTVIWLAEGLLAYLTEEMGDRMVGTAAALSVPGSRLGLTLADPERLRSWREARPDGGGRGHSMALWRSAAPRDAVAWLASHGWRAQLYGAAERSSTYGRPFAGAGTTHTTSTADTTEERLGEKLGARLVDATRF